jgi:hypothetical protein
VVEKTLAIKLSQSPGVVFHRSAGHNAPTPIATSPFPMLSPIAQREDHGSKRVFREKQQFRMEFALDAASKPIVGQRVPAV